MVTKIQIAGPATVTLPSIRDWPRDDGGNPLEITVENTGDGDLVVSQPHCETIVMPPKSVKIVFTMPEPQS